MLVLLKIKRRDFFQQDSIPILMSRTVKTRKFKLLYFRNETCYRLKWRLSYFGAKMLFYTQFLRPYGPVCVLAKIVTLRPCSLYMFCTLTLLSTNMQYVIICASVLMSLWYSWRGGGGGTPLHKPYRYVPTHWVGFLCCFCLKTGIDFAHFGLESGMVFEGIMGTYE